MFKFFNLGKIRNPKNNNDDIIVNFNFYKPKLKELNIKNFDILNEYLDYVYKNYDKDIYNKLWNLYTKLIDRDLIIKNNQKLNEEVKKTIYSIIDLINYNRILEWIKKEKYKTLKMPKDIKESFDIFIEKNGIGSKEQTYIEEEYYHLICLALITKALSYVFILYKDYHGQDINNKLINIYLFRLVKDHPLFKINENENDITAYSRLVRYVEKTCIVFLEDKVNTANLVFSGISLHYIIEWLLAGIIVKKLPVSEIEQTNGSSDNLVTNIYGYIQQNIVQKGDYKTRVNDKNMGEGGRTSGARDEDEKSSILEQQVSSATSIITSGDVIEFNWYFKDIYYIKDKYFPEIPTELLDIFLKTEKQFLNMDLEDIQINILSWILSPIINYNVLNYIYKENMIRLVMLARAWLWHYEHYYLSAFLGSIKIEEENLTIFIDGKSRINKDIKESLEYYYPCNKIIHSKKQNNNTNPIIDVLNNTSNEIYNNNWLYIGPKDDIILEKIEQYDPENDFLNPTNEIKVIIGNFIINIAKVIENNYKNKYKLN